VSVFKKTINLSQDLNAQLVKLKQPVFLSTAVNATHYLTPVLLRLKKKTISKQQYPLKTQWHLIKFLLLYPHSLLNFTKSWSAIALNNGELLLNPFQDFGAIFSFNNRPISKNYLNLILKQKQTRFYVNLLNENNLNYLHLSVGMFLKYFESKKSLKKKKFLKILMIKYLRKFFIVTKIKIVRFLFKSLAGSLHDFFFFFNKRLGKRFTNPLTGKIIDETEQSRLTTQPHSLIFINNKSFTAPLKLRKRGRIKRKIWKKLVKLNNVID